MDAVVRRAMVVHDGMGFLRLRLDRPVAALDDFLRFFLSCSLTF